MSAIVVLDLDVVIGWVEENESGLGAMLALSGFEPHQVGVVGWAWDPAGAVLGAAFRWGGDRTREALLCALNVLVAGGAEGRVHGIVLVGRDWDRAQIDAFTERTGVVVWACKSLGRWDLAAARRYLEQTAAARVHAELERKLARRAERGTDSI